MACMAFLLEKDLWKYEIISIIFRINAMEIKELMSFSSSELICMQILMKQLSEKLVLTEEDLKNVIEDKNNQLFVLCEEDRIIGCAVLCVFKTLSSRKGYIEDVVVLDEYRGRHLGRLLMEHVLIESKKYAPLVLHLTSNPKRVVANKLYQTLGFQKKETNAYQMIIP